MHSVRTRLIELRVRACHFATLPAVTPRRPWWRRGVRRPRAHCVRGRGATAGGRPQPPRPRAPARWCAAEGVAGGARGAWWAPAWWAARSLPARSLPPSSSHAGARNAYARTRARSQPGNASHPRGIAVPTTRTIAFAGASMMLSSVRSPSVDASPHRRSAAKSQSHGTLLFKSTQSFSSDSFARAYGALGRERSSRAREWTDTLAVAAHKRCPPATRPHLLLRNARHFLLLQRRRRHALGLQASRLRRTGGA